MMRKYLFFFMFMLCVCVLHAQDGDASVEETTELERALVLAPDAVDPGIVSDRNGYSSEAIEAKRFDNQKWKQIIGEHNYREDRAAKKKQNPGGTDSGNSQAPGNKRLKPTTPEEPEYDEQNASSPWNSLILTIIFYTVAFGIVGTILYLIFKNVSIKSSTKVPTTDPLEAVASVEDIQELEIDRLLREAMASGNYRMVIRLYFLEVLQKLDQDGIIIWKKDKTNRDYLTELFVKEYFYGEVKNLTLAYEEVWYGDHSLSEQSYTQVIASFKDLIGRLKTSNPA